MARVGFAWSGWASGWGAGHFIRLSGWPGQGAQVVLVGGCCHMVLARAHMALVGLLLDSAKVKKVTT